MAPVAVLPNSTALVAIWTKSSQSGRLLTGTVLGHSTGWGCFLVFLMRPTAYLHAHVHSFPEKTPQKSQCNLAQSRELELAHGRREIAQDRTTKAEHNFSFFKLHKNVIQLMDVSSSRRIVPNPQCSHKRCPVPQAETLPLGSISAEMCQSGRTVIGAECGHTIDW